MDPRRPGDSGESEPGRGYFMDRTKYRGGRSSRTAVLSGPSGLGWEKLLEGGRLAYACHVLDFLWCPRALALWVGLLALWGVL